MQASTKVGRVTIKRVKAKDLSIHPDAQRRLVPGNLRKIMRNLNLAAIGVVYAVAYIIKGVDAVWVIDGQHRIEALVRSGLGDHMVHVYIYMDVNDTKTSCDLFLQHNETSKVAVYDTYIAALKAEKTDALLVDAILHRHGLKAVRGGAHVGTVCCLNFLLKASAVETGIMLDKTLEMAKSSWGNVPTAMEGKILDGLFRVYSAHNGSIDPDSMRTKLSKYSGGPSNLLGQARALHGMYNKPVGACVAQLIIDRYNVGRKGTKLAHL